MATLASLVVSLVLDSAKFGKQLDEEIGRIERVRRRLKDTGASMMRVGGAMTAGITLPLIGMGAAAVNAASDYEESLNKVRVVFGDAAAQIEEFSKTAATNLGMSSQQALEAAGTYGNLFTAMGIGVDTSAEMSTELVQLAADLASFNNMDPTEVLDKLRSGLVGEVEPLRTLGVNLSQTAIAAKALELGLIDVAEGEKVNATELSAGVKAQAAYAIILEQTATAQGDYARTADGLANSTRTARAMIREMAISLGQELLPFTLQAITFVKGLMTQFMALDPSTKRIILVVAALAAAAGPLLVALGAIVSAIGALISPIGLVIVIVGLLAAAWATNFGGIRDMLTNLWANTLQPIFSKLATWLQKNIPVALQALSRFWRNVLLPAIRAVWNFISKVLWPILVGIADILSAVVGTAVRALAGLWQNVLYPALQKVWSWLSEKLGPALRTIGSVVATWLGPKLQWLNDKIVQPLIHGFGGIVDAARRVREWMGRIADKIRSLKLPDWLTPGSPTPFELGLRGIAKSLKQIDQIGMPSFMLQPAMTSVTNVTNVPAAGRRGDVYITVDGSRDPQATAREIMRQLRLQGVVR